MVLGLGEHIFFGLKTIASGQGKIVVLGRMSTEICAQQNRLQTQKAHAPEAYVYIYIYAYMHVCI